VEKVTLKLKINPEYQKLLPELPKPEYNLLKQSIKALGQLAPIIVNEQREILDGHNRYSVCLELGIEPKFESKTFHDKLEEKRFVIVTNLRRRHLNKFQRAELGLPLLEIEKELAKHRQEKAGEIFGRGQDSSSSNELNLSEGQARDIVAKQVMLSPTTFQRALTVVEEGSEELKEKVRKGKTSITYAYKSVKRKAKHEQTPALPKGQFDIIYADPPWEYEVPLRGDPEFHYQTMTTQTICDLEIPMAENAILFLWATNPKLEDALKVMKAWGFQYKTNLVWIKEKFGTGYYFRGQHELLLIGKKGEIPPPTEENRPPSVLEAPRKGHSEKPNVVYEIIEKMYPNRKYLELFARNKKNGWASWGL